MSKFAYKAEGELNSKYLLELLQDYLAKILEVNDTKGIVEDNFNINTKSSRVVKWFKDKTKRIKLNKTVIENYNKVLATQYVNEIQNKLQIFLQTNVLEAKQFFDLKQILKAIKFDVVIPEIEENRNKVIIQSQKKFLNCLNDIKYLKYASIDYILYDSPVNELKPFLSDKVSVHNVDFKTLQNIVKKFIDLRYAELTQNNFEEYEHVFNAREEDFYKDNITDNGVGEDVEAFIREKMFEKLNLYNNDRLVEDNQLEANKIDNLLKRLKLLKIERMMQSLAELKLNLARAKEVIDRCKDIINQSTITGKSSIFLIMDNLYYKLSKKCETLQQKIKLKLQLVDKQKTFDMIGELQNSQSKKLSNEGPDFAPSTNKTKENRTLPNLYDDEDGDGEIHITEDDDSVEAEEEIVIDNNETDN